VPAGVLPGLEMVADENGIESRLFSKTGELQQLRGPELLRRGFVSDCQQLKLLVLVIVACAFVHMDPRRLSTSIAAATSLGGTSNRRFTTKTECEPTPRCDCLVQKTRKCLARSSSQDINRDIGRAPAFPNPSAQRPCRFRKRFAREPSCVLAWL
jgi:hypothetical protein